MDPPLPRPLLLLPPQRRGIAEDPPVWDGGASSAGLDLYPETPPPSPPGGNFLSRADYLLFSQLANLAQQGGGAVAGGGGGEEAAVCAARVTPHARAGSPPGPERATAPPAEPLGDVSSSESEDSLREAGGEGIRREAGNEGKGGSASQRGEPRSSPGRAAAARLRSGRALARGGGGGAAVRGRGRPRRGESGGGRGRGVAGAQDPKAAADELGAPPAALSLLSASDHAFLFEAARRLAQAQPLQDGERAKRASLLSLLALDRRRRREELERRLGATTASYDHATPRQAAQLEQDARERRRAALEGEGGRGEGGAAEPVPTPTVSEPAAAPSPPRPTPTQRVTRAAARRGDAADGTASGNAGAGGEEGEASVMGEGRGAGRGGQAPRAEAARAAAASAEAAARASPAPLPVPLPPLPSSFIPLPGWSGLQGRKTAAPPALPRLLSHTSLRGSAPHWTPPLARTLVPGARPFLPSSPALGAARARVAAPRERASSAGADAALLAWAAEHGATVVLAAGALRAAAGRAGGGDLAAGPEPAPWEARVRVVGGQGGARLLVLEAPLPARQESRRCQQRRLHKRAALSLGLDGGAGELAAPGRAGAARTVPREAVATLWELPSGTKVAVRSHASARLADGERRCFLATKVEYLPGGLREAWEPGPAAEAVAGASLLGPGAAAALVRAHIPSGRLVSSDLLWAAEGGGGPGGPPGRAGDDDGLALARVLAAVACGGAEPGAAEGGPGNVAEAAPTGDLGHPKPSPTPTGPSAADTSPAGPSAADPFPADPSSIDPSPIDPLRIDPSPMGPLPIDPSLADPSLADPMRALADAWALIERVVAAASDLEPGREYLVRFVSRDGPEILRALETEGHAGGASGADDGLTSPSRARVYDPRAAVAGSLRLNTRPQPLVLPEWRPVDAGVPHVPGTLPPALPAGGPSQAQARHGRKRRLEGPWAWRVLGERGDLDSSGGAGVAGGARVAADSAVAAAIAAARADYRTALDDELD